MRWERVKKGRDGIEIGLPGKRWGHTFNSIRGGRLLYLFGGYGRDNCRTNQVHVFDTLSRSWSQPVVKGTPPIPRDSHTCTTIGDNLFVFGGTDGVTQLRDLHILDTCSNTWISPSVSGETPEPVEGHSAALIGTRLFIFGGCGKSKFSADGVCYNDLYILNTETFIWTRPVTSGTPPSARESHTCSSWGNKMIVIGGEDRNDYYFGDVHVLDTDTLVWKDLDVSGHSLPPLAGHSAVAFDKYLLVLGGFSNGQNLYGDLYMLDLGTCNWTKIYATGDGPSPRFSMAGDFLDPAVSGALAFIGGCSRSLDALDDMYFLYTDLVRESGRDERRLEKLSLRKLLKLKCQEPNLPALSLDKALVPFGSPDRHEPVAISQDENMAKLSVMRGSSMSTATPMADCFLKKVKKHIKYLKRMKSGKYLTKDEQESILTKSSTSHSIEDFIKLAKDVVEVISTIKENTSRERYLCISDGYTILCLDLKQFNSDTPKALTKVSTFNLRVGGFPVSLYLFKWRSRACIVGGAEFRSLENVPSCSYVEVLKSVYREHGLKGISSKMYELALVDGALRLSESDIISSPSKPKWWPIAVKVEDQVHVIESDPLCTNFRLQIEPSHEVLKLNDPISEWFQLSQGFCISDFVVVGPRIYACFAEGNYEHYVDFDSKTNKWEVRAYRQESRCSSMFPIKHVAELLKFGFGKCVPKFMDGNGPPYVVIAIWEDLGAVAFLVTPLGQVLCFQRLSGFFEGFKKIIDISRGIVISVDEERGDMCAIVDGREMDMDFLYITVFVVEEVAETRSLVSRLWKTRSDKDDVNSFPYPEEEDFVNVIVKNSYEHRWETSSKSAQLADPGMGNISSRLSASFL